MAKPKVRIFKIHHKHEEEHAHGVWKVAFADFVTGMMAFFLLLWILNIAAEQNSSGFSIFYAPNNLSTALSGMGERDLGRDNTATQGQRISSRAISREVTTIPSFGQKSSTATTGVLIDQSSSIETGNNFMDNNTPIKTIDGKKRSQILQSIINRVDPNYMQKQIIVEPLPNGIRVQLVDDLKQKIFTKRNSSELSIFTQKFLDLIASIITQTDFKIFASAHSQKFKTQAGDSFSVWDLTAERALNIYRYLIEKGTNPENIANISAHGDYQLYIPEEPHSLQNNRISLELKLL